MATQQHPPVHPLTPTQLTTVIFNLQSQIQDRETFLAGGSACQRAEHDVRLINKWVREDRDALSACLALFKQQTGRIFTGL